MSQRKEFHGKAVINSKKLKTVQDSYYGRAALAWPCSSPRSKGAHNSLPNRPSETELTFSEFQFVLVRPRNSKILPYLVKALKLFKFHLTASKVEALCWIRIGVGVAVSSCQLVFVADLFDDRIIGCQRHIYCIGGDAELSHF